MMALKFEILKRQAKKGGRNLRLNFYRSGDDLPLFLGMGFFDSESMVHVEFLSPDEPLKEFPDPLVE
jgi:hypothetical protein